MEKEKETLTPSLLPLVLGSHLILVSHDKYDHVYMREFGEALVCWLIMAVDNTIQRVLACPHFLLLSPARFYKMLSDHGVFIHLDQSLKDKCDRFKRKIRKFITPDMR